MKQVIRMNRNPVRCGVKMQTRFRGICFICLRDCDEVLREACIKEMSRLANLRSSDKTGE